MALNHQSKIFEVPTVTLNDGTKLPLIGFGTCNIGIERQDDPSFDSIKTAIKCGYRFIDTAAVYKNEKAVGLAVSDCIKEGLIKREDVYICTKVWCTAHKRESVMEACKESLRKLGLSYIDMYLIHWPVAFEEDGDIFIPKDSTGKLRYSDTHYTETWKGMEDVKDAGLARSIGVSNFNHKMVDAIFAMPCKHKPSVNQVECHPYLTQQNLLEYSNKNGIVLNAYCPLGSPDSCATPNQPAVLKDPVVVELAKKYNKCPSHILIRFQIQRNIPVIPKSATSSRIKANFEVFDFKISEEDMEKLLSINRNIRYCTKTGGETVTDHPLYPFHIEF